jgi:pimeloyl-ACP methyl ester carboxylesterase
LPSPVRIDTIARAGELQQLIERVMAVGGAAPFGSTPAVRQAAQRRLGLTRDYVQTSHGQMHVRRGGPVTGTPLLMLHDAPGSSLGVHRLAERLAERRPVLAPDLPGCGDSDAPDWPRPDESLAPYADALAEELDGVVDVYGEGAGAALALELSTRHPQQVRLVFVHRLPALEPREE